MKPTDLLIEPYIVSTSEISEMIGLSDRRIQQLTKKGALIKVAHGKYDLKLSIKQYIEYSINEKMDKVKLDDDNEIDGALEAALWTKARKEKTELEVKIIQGDLHRSKDVERIMNQVLGGVRAGLLSLPSKIAPQLLALEDIPHIKSILTREIKEIMSDISKYDKSKFYQLSSDKLFIEENEPIATEDD
ncbi:type IV toxin-antitoxin system AbiEi family antitoxin domain-containing protein [Niallia taxi]|uniref:hypothetical protein n=1 Tax=Niallia taxi TaxID=2499688 RepID=UPI0039826DE0